MPEATQTPSTTVEATVKPKRNFSPKVFVTNHPRVARVGALVGFGAVVAVGTSVAKNLKANRAELAAASDQAQEALHNLADAVSTPETDA